jgi:hypothetical protein
VDNSIFMFAQGKQPPSLARDFFVGVLPLLFLLTVLSGRDSVLVLLCSISLAVFVMSKSHYHALPEFGRDPPGRVSALSYFRGGNMLLTCICILAVDFEVLHVSMITLACTEHYEPCMYIILLLLCRYFPAVWQRPRVWALGLWT